MYLLIFLQNSYEIPLALFDTLQSGREFVAKIPGYQYSEERIDNMTFTSEKFNPSDLPDYMELTYNGNTIPLTRFMFPDDGVVEIFWRQIPNMEIQGTGIVEGSTTVDAYSVDNKDVESYIAKREQMYSRVKAFLEHRGYEIDRHFRGSEDGEAVMYRKRDTSNWHFLTHMDPVFVEGLTAEEILEYICEEE